MIIVNFAAVFKNSLIYFDFHFTFLLKMKYYLFVIVREVIFFAKVNLQKDFNFYFIA